MRRALLAAYLVAFSMPAAAGPDPSRDVLWAALKTCVLAKRVANRTFPCLSVDLGDKDRPGSAVLRAPGEPTHIVVMPTDTVAGLEAPVLRGSSGIAYWRAALAARPFVSDAPAGKLPTEAIGLAVNSAQGRSQDQLHIHLDCLKPSVLKAVRAHARQVRRTWSRFPVPLAGDRYFALRVPEAEAEFFNPFAALHTLPGGRPDLHQTSFAALATPPGDPEPGFLVLAYRVPGASAEDVMDHSCAVASGRSGA
ncbi:CDP-diacylglycerol diphosphatase [Methylobacterium sp. J-070]|uniref:CDP-diacylglycerol diphosphatase n=1 Tax=Methylobacterium sp. J-070 TaxID=2836650 RepID=UPI001FB91F6C|nr:CDP-diacylglycerol diphosphatase [Methylobacterium sp. J-070]MCJ2049352.1 CDP-diacylglycerol diphosphatase [Methylobacterium sp. J-070]